MIGLSIVRLVASDILFHNCGDSNNHRREGKVQNLPNFQIEPHLGGGLRCFEWYCVCANVPIFGNKSLRIFINKLTNKINVLGKKYFLIFWRYSGAFGEYFLVTSIPRNELFANFLLKALFPIFSRCKPATRLLLTFRKVLNEPKRILLEE